MVVLSGLAVVLTALAVLVPETASAAPSPGAGASCGQPCDPPAVLAGRPAGSPHGVPGVPRSCMQSAGCGGAAVLGLTAGLALVGMAVTAAFDRPRPRLLRRRTRRRDRPPTGAVLGLLRPPQFA